MQEGAERRDVEASEGGNHAASGSNYRQRLCNHDGMRDSGKMMRVEAAGAGAVGTVNGGVGEALFACVAVKYVWSEGRCAFPRFWKQSLVTFPSKGVVHFVV